MVPDGQINSFYGSIFIIKLVEYIDSTNAEFTQLIHDPQNDNGTFFSHSTLTKKITNFTMENTMTQDYYGIHHQIKSFKTVTFFDRNVRLSKKWSH